MKQYFRLIMFFLLTGDLYAQSKKEIIENLNLRVDSLNSEIIKREIIYNELVLTNRKTRDSLMFEINNIKFKFEKNQRISDSLNTVNKQLIETNYSLNKGLSELNDSIDALV